jgi:hypothetical protein
MDTIGKHTIAQAVLVLSTQQYVIVIYVDEWIISSWPNLCDVSTMVRPRRQTSVRASHIRRLAAGSIPVVGSSRKMRAGSPTRAMAVLSFLLLPPLEEKQKQQNHR